MLTSCCLNTQEVFRVLIIQEKKPFTGSDFFQLGWQKILTTEQNYIFTATISNLTQIWANSQFTGKSVIIWFWSWLCAFRGSCDLKDDVKAAFKVFDHNNDGSISRSKLLLIIVESGEGDNIYINNLSSKSLTTTMHWKKHQQVKIGADGNIHDDTKVKKVTLKCSTTAMMVKWLLSQSDEDDNNDFVYQNNDENCWGVPMIKRSRQDLWKNHWGINH